MFKALDDISFSIEQGEVVGIIGHNGAGKSTLLKMLAGISSPTSGHIKVNGRIAPLIEVGAGFVPDFTGRENVYLNGSIMGLSRKEIDCKFDEIVGFAEMSEFIDTPVKRYSSGMQVKLAFAVATSIDAEILIVDEVLAVGDLAFQRKCFDRMENLIKREGRTVLLVSHNIRQVERMCNRALLLSQGRIIMDDVTKLVCKHFYEESDRQITKQSTASSKIRSTGEVELLDIHCISPNSPNKREILYDKDTRIRIRLKIIRELVAPIFLVGIHTTDFVYVATASSKNKYRDRTLSAGIHVVELDIAHFPILPGAYSLRLSIDVEDPIKNVLYGESLYHFSVVDSNMHHIRSPVFGFIPLADGEWSILSV